MTNLEKLIKAIAESSYDDLLEFLKKFGYWFDPGGWCDDEMITDYLKNDYEDYVLLGDPMTNFEKYISNLTQDKFIDSMILNCDGCPAYPCNYEHNTEDNGIDCEEKLRDWCDDVAKIDEI